VSAVEASLRRLGTDYIDLYQMHTPDLATDRGDAACLDDLVIEGKVRYVGHSNFTGHQIADAERIARALGSKHFITRRITTICWSANRDRGHPRLRACRTRTLALLSVGVGSADRQVTRVSHRRRVRGCTSGAAEGHRAQ